MKALILILLISFSFKIKAQLNRNDTIICKIDTTNCCVNIVYNPLGNKMKAIPWILSINGNYYKNIAFLKEYARVIFVPNNVNRIWYNKDYSEIHPIKISQRLFKNRNFRSISDRWIIKQKNIEVLQKKLGQSSGNKYFYVVFKQDIGNVKNDSVSLHRVWISVNSELE